MSTEESIACSSISGPLCYPDYGIECKYLPCCRKIVKFLISELTDPVDDRDFKTFDLVLLDTDLNFYSPELYGIILQTKRTAALILTNGGFVVYRTKRRILKLRLNLITYEWKLKFRTDIENSQELRDLVLW